MKRRRARIEWVAVVTYAIWLFLALVGLAYVLAQVVPGHWSM